MDKPPPSPTDRRPSTAAPADQRKTRLASALRANLKRRKAAAPPKPPTG